MEKVEDQETTSSEYMFLKIMSQVVEGEGVTAVHFADSFPGKNNFDLSKCLYIGTSLGSVLVIVIVVPEAETR